MSVQPLSEDAVSMLLLLGFNAYHDAQLLTQLARIFRHMTLSNTILFASPATIKEAYERACMVSQTSGLLWMPSPIGIITGQLLWATLSRQLGNVKHVA